MAIIDYYNLYGLIKKYFLHVFFVLNKKTRFKYVKKHF